MIRSTTRLFAIAGMIGFAAYGNAGTGAVTPAIAKSLVVERIMF